MKEKELKIGEIVQLNPETVGNKSFAACLMIVTELKSFGAMGYVQGLGDRKGPGGAAYYRANWDEMEQTYGYAQWVAQ